MDEKPNKISITGSGYAFFSTIRRRLALLLLAILVPILIVQIVIYRDRFETRRRLELKANLEIARAMAETFRALLDDLLNQELSIGLALSSFEPLSESQIRGLLKGNKAAYTYLLNLSWVSPAGRVIAASDSLSGIDVSDRSFFHEIVSGRKWAISSLSISEETGFPVFTVSRAVRGPAGDLSGIVVATVLADNLEAAFPLERYDGGAIIIIDHSGRVVIRSPKVDWTWESRDILGRTPFLKEALAGAEITGTIVDTVDQKKHILALAPIRSIGWTLGASRLEDQALAPVFAYLRRQSLLFALVVFISIAVFLLIANSISKPLKRLQRHALNLGKEEPKSLTAFAGPQELVELAEALDFMARELHLKMEALTESESRYRMMGEILPYGVWLCDKEGRVEYVSPSFLELLDMSRVEQKEFEWTKRLVPEDVEPLKEKWLRCVQTGTLWDHEYRIFDRHGKIHTILSRGLPIKDKNGRIKNWAGINLDICKRKETEEALRRLNDTLEQRVAERTRLAEVRAKQLQVLVSELTLAEQRERRRLAEILHDHLQQLLVAARINSEVVCTHIGTNQKRHAEKVVDLITQSIQISRSLTAELSPAVLQEGSLSAALKWLASWMQENHGFELELQTDPGMDPEREDVTLLLFQSIRELLFNVVKHAGVKSARVEMVRDKENRLRVNVIDQGRGFDPGAIWEKAQAGTGFGLLTIRERLMLMGGCLEVESSPGQGAAFALIVSQGKKRNP